jgi:hypothetical protein
MTRPLVSGTLEKGWNSAVSVVCFLAPPRKTNSFTPAGLAKLDVTEADKLNDIDLKMFFILKAMAYRQDNNEWKDGGIEVFEVVRSKGEWNFRYPEKGSLFKLEPHSCGSSKRK